MFSQYHFRFRPFSELQNILIFQKSRRREVPGENWTFHRQGVSWNHQGKFTVDSPSSASNHETTCHLVQNWCLSVIEGSSPNALRLSVANSGICLKPTSCAISATVCCPHVALRSSTLAVAKRSYMSSFGGPSP